MRDLFLGTGIAHTILLFAVVIALGLYLGSREYPSAPHGYSLSEFSSATSASGETRIFWHS